VLDVLIKDGLIVDGSGSQAYRGDVGIADGRIAVIGSVEGPARQVVAAADLVVAPGFVDIHTHYDAQALWDPYMVPSCLHGVTTVIGGNCGFTVAPIDDESASDVRELLSVVEAIPVEALASGTDWTWRTFGDYLERLEGRLAVNAGFLVGHSPIRRLVMRGRANEVATSADISAMVQLLHEGIASGGLGFSSSWGYAHSGAPSLAATSEELIRLAEVAGNHEGTVLEFIPGLTGGDDAEGAALMAAMSQAADRSLNWNVLAVRSGDPSGYIDARLAISDYASIHDGAVFLLTIPVNPVVRTNFRTGFLFNSNPAWNQMLFAGDLEDRKRALADPTARRNLSNAAESESALKRIYRLDALEVERVRSPDLAHLEGQRIGDIAFAQDVTPIDALFNIVLADDLWTVLRYQDPDNDDVWQQRQRIWNDPRIVIGGSDAGAHLDSLTTYGIYSTFTGDHVRDGRISLERAVQLTTDRPARLYGLKRRGRIALGWQADVVLFDRDALANEPPELRSDMPGGASRLIAGARGIGYVFVNGKEIVREGQVTGALPGQVLRSGRDTETVTVQEAHRLAQGSVLRAT
jgi:N-acyl-D-aspartate/D-glutamate deacylase